VATITDATGKNVNGTVFTLRVDPEYIDTYGMTLVAGRNFIKGSLADSLNVIVNEETTRAYGYQDPEEAIGKAFYFGDTKGEIIGVVKDFHYSSLQQKIAPTCMFLLRDGFSRIAVRLRATDDITLVANAWKKHFPDTVPEYALAETRLNDQYHAEQRFSKLFAVFSTISLAIACLGLFALVSYSVEARTKEIGIRKVLGATVLNIVNLLSGEFLVLIVCSCLIAIPVAYYFMGRWLEGFAYHITMSPSVFAVAGIASLLIAAITIGLRSVRSAMNNPVDSLRNE
jgi:putative ABC transport system permease protein